MTAAIQLGPKRIGTPKLVVIPDDDLADALAVAWAEGIAVSEVLRRWIKAGKS
jgi:hypothetical protein